MVQGTRVWSNFPLSAPFCSRASMWRSSPWEYCMKTKQLSISQGISKRQHKFANQRSLGQLNNFQIGPNPIYLYNSNELVQVLIEMKETISVGREDDPRSQEKTIQPNSQRCPKNKCLPAEEGLYLLTMTWSHLARCKRKEEGFLRYYHPTIRSSSHCQGFL